MTRRGGKGCGGLILVIVLAAAIAIGIPTWLWRGAGPLTHPASFTVKDGETLPEAARALEKAGAIRSAPWFRRLATRFGSPDPIRAGEYQLPARIGASAILDLLQHGRPKTRLVTIPEGMPAVLVQARLAAVGDLTGTAPLPPEGSVLPDSYGYEKGDTRAALLKRMQAAMTKELATLWKARKPNLVVTTPQQAIILASILEKETAKAAERRMVAGVYSNRLRQQMPLQADPTVIYPITQGRPLGRRIRQSELHAVNGYNTYARPGLPIGPIANPGRASIAAVLDPADTKALYFVADGTGGHVFADTLAEHNANVRKWYAIRHARGQM